ncbi:uncharacterized protein BXZ73DRAFT_82455 [Epithele typhae]|uniref:uncharacterized protein n=1 Tax=Epithele typhae TaxID=378194 RepID=UPI002008E204|nr:uncharacterized protein BXZ73DRAFT_82455 [Epithele typhae]KAH9912161.1 hypothetical protein BXZ73DRAFT_82455 [Epithele typhae]
MASGSNILYAGMVLYRLLTSPHNHADSALRATPRTFRSASTSLSSMPTQTTYTICKVDVRPPREPWYAARINRLGKIPAIAYDVPADCDPCDPPTGTLILPESHAILEFLADVLPAARILPPTSELATFRSTFLGALLTESASVQADLPGTGWVAGGWRMAEMVAGLHVVRAVWLLERDVGRYPEEEGRKAWEELMGDDEYKRVRVCVQEIAAHPTFKATYTEASNVAVWSGHPLLQRDRYMHVVTICQG